MIELSYGGAFEERDLVEYINNELQYDYIIQGQKVCNEEDHPKTHSLDYWLRQFADKHNIKQADNSVMEALIATGLFVESDNLVCPDSGRTCKGLVIA